MTARGEGTDRLQLLDRLLAAAPLALYSYGLDGVCTYAAGAVLSRIGMPPSVLVGADLFALEPQDRERADRLRAAVAGRTLRYRRTYRGTVLDTWLSPLVDTDGRVVGAVGISIDVTEAAQAEQVRDLFRAFVDAAPQFVALSGMDGRVRYLNPAGRALAGVPDELDVTTTTIADYLTPEGLRINETLERPAVVAEGSYEGESTLRHWPTEAGIPVHVSSFLVRAASGGPPIAQATVQTDIREIVAAQEALEVSVARQRGLIVHLHEAQEAERRRIAADVHDDTLQVLASATLRLQALGRQARQRGGEDLAVAAEALGVDVRDAIVRLRRLFYELEPGTDRSPQPLGARIEGYARATLGADGPALELEVPLDLEIPPVAAQILFRIAQEALRNTVAHARARRVEVRVRADEKAVVLTVTDDGRGLPRAPGPVATGRGGLLGMVQRAESAGGSCVVGAGPGGIGTEVRATLPARIGDLDASANRSGRWAFLEQTMESINDGFAAIDNGWRYVYVNRVGEQALGRGPGELIGKVIWEEFSVPPETERHFRRSREEMRPVAFEEFYPLWGRWFHSRVFPSESGLSIFFRDITEQKEQERAVCELDRRERLRGDVLDALQAEPDLSVALRRAAQLMCEALQLGCVTVEAGPLAVRVGAPSGQEEHRVPLSMAGRRVGELRWTGTLSDQEVLLPVLALRIAAGQGTTAAGR